MSETAENKTQEITPEQQAMLDNGRQSSDALKPDSNKPSKEALEEEHGTDEDKSEKPEEKKDEPKQEENSKPDDNQEDVSWKQQYITIDNPHAQSAIDLLKEANVSPVEANDIFKAAIESGDINKVDWVTLEAKIGKSKTHLVRTGVEAYYEGQFKQQQATVQEGYKEFGGEEGWKKAREYFQKREKTDPEFAKALVEYREMLDKGGLAGSMALKALKAEYNNDPKNTAITTKKLETGDRAVDIKSSGALTKAEYQAELAKIDSYDNAAYTKLRARRAAGIQAGI